MIDASPRDTYGVKQRHVEYPWWAVPATGAMLCASLYLTGFGNTLVAAGWPLEEMIFFVGVFVVADVASSIFGFAGARAGANNEPGKAIGCMIISLLAAALGFVGAQRTLNYAFDQNADTMVVEERLVEQRGAMVETAQQRLDDAKRAIEPLERQVKAAEREFNIEVQSGFEERSIQRKAEWDDAIEKLRDARTEVTEAQANLEQMQIDGLASESSDAALVAASTTAWERTFTVYFGAALVQLLPLLAGWLLGSVREEYDRLEMLQEEVHALRAQLAAGPVPHLRQSTAKTRDERYDEQTDEIGAAVSGLFAERDELAVDEEATEERKRRQGSWWNPANGDDGPVAAPETTLPAPPRRLAVKRNSLGQADADVDQTQRAPRRLRSVGGGEG